jgi:hypothetical protein
MKRKRRVAATTILLPLAVLIAAVSLTAAVTVKPSSWRDNRENIDVKLTSSTSVRHILTGILDRNKRSKDIALFEINGVLHRIRLGENIGSSGWTLVEVNQQEALIRRNGEVRSIYLGQGFEICGCEATSVETL